MKISDSNILIHHFLDAAEQFAGNTAIEKGELKFTYDALKQQAMKYVAALEPDSSAFAAVLARRSLAAFAGITGILMSSKSYVPLNPKFPVKRTVEMLRVSGVKTVIVGDECLEYLRELIPAIQDSSIGFVLENEEDVNRLSAEFPGYTFNSISTATSDSPLKTDSSEDDPAYLLFTSGSIGKPKAVAVNNLNVTSYLRQILKDYDFKPDDRFSHTFDLTFDLSVHDMFVCWLSGACLVIPESDSPFKFASYIKEKQISVWFSVPSVAVMLDKIRKLKKASFPSLRLSFFCGEALYLATAGKWQQAAPDSMVVNLYGPAEATIAISQYRFSESKSNQERNGILSIGHIFDGQHYFITEDYQKESEKGELCLSGSQVIHQYYQNEESSLDQFFVKDNRHWYKTGDIVCRDEEGRLFYLGRADAEVKISGYRVNLHEIENQVSDITGGSKVVAIYLKKDKEAAGNIVLFLKEELRKEIDESDIIEHCRNNLPWYMLPERIVFIDEFPLNENGKTDRNQLKRRYL